MKTVIAGIDPGFSGAMAIWDGVHLSVYDAEATAQEWAPRWLRAMQLYGVSVVDIEAVHSMPSQGVKSAFQFGKAFGIVQGISACHLAHHPHMPLYLTSPQAWKALARIPRGAGKEISRQRAQELFPAYADLFKRAKDDGRAEAALIAWARWQVLGEWQTTPAPAPAVLEDVW